MGRYGKICKNGGEANSIAIRIARAATGKSKIHSVVTMDGMIVLICKFKK